MPFNPAYGLLMIAGIAVSAKVWRRVTRGSRIPLMVFVGGLIGAIVGAKLVYFVAELPLRWNAPHFWQNVLFGRTLLGGFLGGYLGVEWGKRVTGYSSPTGDSFAIAVPLGVAVGRVGCYLHGCCQGSLCNAAWYAVRDTVGAWRYPAALSEAAFHLSAAGLLAILLWRGVLRGQLFHVYLMAYGAFRFASEYWRDTPRTAGGFSPYQVLALALIAFGVWRYCERRALSILPASRTAGGAAVRKR